MGKQKRRPPKARSPAESSDEEIDSDLASIPDEVSPHTAEISTAKGADRRQVLRAANALTAGRDYHRDLDDVPKNEDDSDCESDTSNPLSSAAALANVTFAAVRRTRKATKNLRKVDPVSQAAANTFGSSTNVDDASHPEMMSRILETLGNANSTALAPEVQTSDLQAVAKKLAKVHDEESELHVPEERVVTEKIERKTTYDMASKDVTKNWENTVQHNRQVDHISFPLSAEGPLRTTTGDMTKPRNRKNLNPYEEEIHQILRDAGVSADPKPYQPENDLDADQLCRKLESKKELQTRHAELAKMRSDLFKYEQKMKRIKKIKSKDYRKVLRKEKQKLDVLDSNFKDAVTEATRAEQKRVEERVTLRHKNTSKWIRRKLQRGEGMKSAGTREAIEEQLRVHQQLMVKQGHTSASDDDVSDSGGEDNAELELRAIETELVEDASNPPPTQKKGLMSLKFMQTAEARERKKAEDMIRASLSTEGQESEHPSQGVVGRMSFAGKSEGGTENCHNDSHHDTAEVDCEDVEIVRTYDQDAAVGNIRSHDNQPRENIRNTIDDAKHARSEFTALLESRLAANSANPWLSIKQSTGRSEKKGKIRQNQLLENGKLQNVRNDKDTPNHENEENGRSRRVTVTTPSRSQPNKKRKSAPKSIESEREGNVAVSKKKKSTASKALTKDVNCEKLNTMKGKNPEKDTANSVMRIEKTKDNDDVSRMEEVAAAFSGAGGADLADFQAAKEAEIEAELPTAKSLHAEVLPGWGQWDGAGMSKKAKERRGESAFARAARERLEESRRQAVAARSDRNLKNVILEQRRSQKAASLTLETVPFPYVTREQWRRELSNPVTNELTSSAAFSENVRKKVEVKVGSVIQPLSAETRWLPDRHMPIDKEHSSRVMFAKRKDRVESRDKARRGFMS